MKNIFITVMALATLMACETNKGTQRAEGLEEEKVDIPVPDFKAEKAYQFIADQVNFGPRVPNTTAHRETKQYLADQLVAFGATVVEQDFEAKAYDGELLQLTNIIGSFFPEKQKRILLAAHWDTRKVADKDTERVFDPIDGANDGGSGVGVLLEIARILGSSDLKPNIGIDIIFFDGEDNGRPEFEDRMSKDELWWCLGSQHWSRNKHKADYTAFYGILLDMVGARGAQFYREGTSVRYAPSIVRKVWNTAHELGFSDFFIKEDGPGITDDHVFVNEIAKIPMIDIVDFDMDSDRLFRDYHHTHADNMDIIDKATLKAVGQTVLQVIYYEK